MNNEKLLEELHNLRTILASMSNDLREPRHAEYEMADREAVRQRVKRVEYWIKRDPPDWDVRGKCDELLSEIRELYFNDGPIYQPPVRVADMLLALICQLDDSDIDVSSRKWEDDPKADALLRLLSYEEIMRDIKEGESDE